MKKVLVAVSCAGVVFSSALLFAQEKGKGKAAGGDAAKGKDAFASNCMICHSPDSDTRLVGPGLKDLFKRAKLGNDKAVDDASVMEIINQGSPNGMPPFGDALTAPEKANILAYLKTL